MHYEAIIARSHSPPSWLSRSRRSRARARRKLQGAAHAVGRPRSAGHLAGHRHGRRAAAARGQLGTRNVLTDEEFRRGRLAASRADRRRQRRVRHRQADARAGSRAATVGGPVSPPPHWLERGKPTRQAWLIVDPPDGRMPPQTRGRRSSARPRSSAHGPDADRRIRTRIAASTIAASRAACSARSCR